MYLAIIILPLLGLIVLGYWLGSGYIKSKIFKVLLSFTFYILLLWPFKVILPLLGLDYLFPIFSGLFACIFTVASCFFLIRIISYLVLFSYFMYL